MQSAPQEPCGGCDRDEMEGLKVGLELLPIRR